ncbi:MAG: hypothetical protein ACQEXX_16395 [Bacillota bacterium]
MDIKNGYGLTLSAQFPSTGDKLVTDFVADDQIRLQLKYELDIGCDSSPSSLPPCI